MPLGGIIIGFIGSVFLAFAVVLDSQGPDRVARFAASLVTLIVTLLVSVLVVSDDGRIAAIAVVAGAIGAIRVGGGRLRGADSWLLVLAVLYFLAMTTLAAWLYAGGRSAAEAGYAVGVAQGLLDGLVIGLVRERFAELIRHEQDERRRLTRAESKRAELAAGDRVWLLLAGFAVPAVLGLGLVLDVAGPALTANRNAGRWPNHLTLLALAGACAVGLAAGAILVAVRRRRGRAVAETWRPDTTPAITRSVYALLAAAAAAWLVPLAVALDTHLHFIAPSIVAALFAATLVAEDLVNSPVRLQLVRLTRGAGALACLGALIAGATITWLLSVGVWSGPRAATVSGGLVATLVGLLPAVALVAAIGVVLSLGLRCPHLTAQKPIVNLAQQPILYGLLWFFAAVVPMYIVAKAGVSRVHDSGIATLANAGVMPSIVGAFAWILGNNRLHAWFEQFVIPTPLEDFASDQPDALREWEQAYRTRDAPPRVVAAVVDVYRAFVKPPRSEEWKEKPGGEPIPAIVTTSLNKLRVDRLRMHVFFANRVATAMLVVGTLWAAIRVF